MARGMELWRPDWYRLMKDCGGASTDSEELVSITRYSAQLALSALRKQNEEDYYHNYGAAEKELKNALLPVNPTK